MRKHKWQFVRGDDMTDAEYRLAGTTFAVQLSGDCCYQVYSNNEKEGTVTFWSDHASLRLAKQRALFLHAKGLS
jgi:hypothetical protein